MMLPNDLLFMEKLLPTTTQVLQPSQSHTFTFKKHSHVFHTKAHGTGSIKEEWCPPQNNDIFLSVWEAGSNTALLELTREAVTLESSTVCDFGPFFSPPLALEPEHFLKNNVWSSEHLLDNLRGVVMASKGSQNFGQQLLWRARREEEEQLV